MGSALDKIKAKYGGQQEQSSVAAPVASPDHEPIDASSHYSGAKVLADLFNPMVNTGDKASAAVGGFVGKPFDTMVNAGNPMTGNILDALGIPNPGNVGVFEDAQNREPIAKSVGELSAVFAPIAAEKTLSGLGLPLLKLILGGERSATIENALKSLSPAFRAQERNAAIAEANAPYNEIVAEENRLAAQVEKAKSLKAEANFNEANRLADEDLVAKRRADKLAGKAALKEQTAGEKAFKASQQAEAKSLKEQAQMQQQADLAAEQRSAERGKLTADEAVSAAPGKYGEIGDETTALKAEVNGILKSAKERVGFSDLASDPEVKTILSKMRRSGQSAKAKSLQKEFKEIVKEAGNDLSMLDADEQKQLFASRAFNERGKMDTDAADFYDSLRRALVNRIRTGLPPEQGAKVEQLDNLITSKLKTRKTLVPSVKKAKKAQSETDALETIFPWLRQSK